MTFLARLLTRLHETPDLEVLAQGERAWTAKELLAGVAAARGFLRARGIAAGDRVGLLGANGFAWVALDLAVMAEGALAAPLYTRQSPDEWRAAFADCTPSLVLCGDGDVFDALGDAHPRAHFEEALAGEPVVAPPAPVPDDPVRIVYTSGTSGRAKGAVLTAANVAAILPHTERRLVDLMHGRTARERVFHYLPFCFAGSWILLLTCLHRRNRLELATNLTKLPEELRRADPHYFLNVPLLLERLREGIEQRVRERGGLAQWLWDRPFWARLLLYPAIRRQLAPSLRALICGSAPLAEDTQRFFMDLGLPVLQVYGLTETTAICTMDRPHAVAPGRVGGAIDGCEMRADEHGEIHVRGPHVFRGYWGEPPHEGWFATGDLGDVDAAGRWRITGRRKNVLVLASGHNVVPEPHELRWRAAIPGAAQVVLVGDGRPALGAIVAGPVDDEAARRAFDEGGADLPHFERVRHVHVHPEPFTPESGLLTANGKVRRLAVHERFAAEVEAMYS